MDNDAERRLEERLDRWTSDLRDALVRIEAKLDAKAQAADVDKLEERLRTTELAFAEYRAKSRLVAGIVYPLLLPAMGLVYFVLKKAGV